MKSRNYLVMATCLFLFLTMVPNSQAQVNAEPLKGDINSSERVDISDVILCLRMSIALPVTIGTSEPLSSPYTPELVDLADMNGEGGVNISDVILILRESIGLVAPAAPANVVSVPGDGLATITWDAVADASSYNIYWSNDPGVTKTGGTKIAGVTSPYNHTGLTNGITYYYIVTTVNSSGESAESDEVSTKPGVPGEGVWNSMGEGFEYPVNFLSLYNGNICAASYGVAVWDGNLWNDMSDGLLALFGAGDVYALAYANGVFYAGGDFTVLTPDKNWYNNAARFDNGSWTTCGSGLANDGIGMNYQVNFLIEYNGLLYAGGEFTAAGGDPLNQRTAAYVANFYEGEWHQVGGGMDNTVTDMAVYNGELIVSGYFTTAAWLTPSGDDYNLNPVSANHIARWNGAWNALGSGMDGKVTALAVHNGELYAGGLFETAGGVPAKNIAKWNGTSWSAVGSGITEQVYTLVSYNNKLYAGGAFRILTGNAGDYIMRWDGSQWRNVGSGTDGPVFSIIQDSQGLIVGGDFSTAGGIPAKNVARFNITE